MLIFITSIRHPRNAKDFRKVEALFEMSLRSVCSQTDPNFRVIVVCNEVPRIGFTDERVIYHTVDFSPHSAEQKLHLRDVYRDKGCKLLTGMLLARRLDPSYFAIFDADDLVSRRIAGYVNARPGTAGWYVDAGYLLNFATWRAQRKHGLVRYCGSTLIPGAADLLRLSGADGRLDEHATQEQILKQVDAEFLDQIIGTHEHMVSHFAGHGLRMRPLPFRASVWIQQHGENQYGDAGTTGLPVDGRFAREFGVTRPAAMEARATFADRVKESWQCLLSKLGSMRARMKGFHEPRRVR